MIIQNALTNFRVLKLVYQNEEKIQKTKRTIKPFTIYNSLQDNWILIIVD